MLRILTLSKVTDLPAWKIKMALGIPLGDCPADTAQEAYEIFHKTKSGVEENISAFLKWVSLCSRAEEAKAAFKLTLEGSYLQRVAQAKWDELSMKEVEEISTLAEMSIMYGVVRTGSPAESLALLKMIAWNDIIGDILEILKITSDGSPEEMAAIKRIAELTTEKLGATD